MINNYYKNISLIEIHKKYNINNIKLKIIIIKYIKYNINN